MIHFIETDKIVMKAGVAYTLLPGHDEQQALAAGNYVEAILMTALRIEHYLKDQYFWQDCKNNMAVYAMVDDIPFYQVIELGRALGYIDATEAITAHQLRKARNEIGHHPYAYNRYLDPVKVKAIVEPCLAIIHKLHTAAVNRQAAAPRP
jgi:hypothetical protein